MLAGQPENGTCPAIELPSRPPQIDLSAMTITRHPAFVTPDAAPVPVGQVVEARDLG